MTDDEKPDLLDEPSDGLQRVRERRVEIEKRGWIGELAIDQTGKASERLTKAPSKLPRFKPRGLHDAVRYLGKRQLWVVAAGTGIGKTTFLLSTTDDLIEQGYKVAFLGLEQEADELRTLFACMKAGVHKAVAIENSWSEHPDGDEQYARVQDWLYRLAEPPYLDRLLFLPHRYINAKVMREAAEDAASFGADALIVDHIHHLKAAGDRYAAFVDAVEVSKKIAEDYDWTSVIAAQIGRKASFGHKLMRYMPPALSDIEGGHVLAQNAHVVIAPYRPLMVPASKADEQRIKMAKEGLIDPREVLRQDTTGVVVLKHRMRGELEGRRALLRLRNGKLIDYEDDDDA